MMQHGLGSHSLRPWFTGSGIIAVFASLVALALATPGDLDFAFGVNGVVTLDLSQEEDRAYAVAIQPDGKIVTVGRVTESAYQRFAIGRHIQNGKLDPEWCASGCLGKPGLVYFFCNQPDTTARYCQFNAVAVGKDGRVVAAGFDKPSFNANADFRVHGFNADGTTAFTTQSISTRVTTRPQRSRFSRTARSSW